MEQRLPYRMLFVSFTLAFIISPIFAFATKSSMVSIQSSNYWIPLLLRGGGTVSPSITITTAVSAKRKTNKSNRAHHNMCLQSSSSSSTMTSQQALALPLSSRGGKRDRRVSSELGSTTGRYESSALSKGLESEGSKSESCAANITGSAAILIVRHFVDRCTSSITALKFTRQNRKTTESTRTVQWSNPRVKACIYMGISMSLHYSGYEFVRNAALSLFTSDVGFPQPLAFPLMNAIVTPLSILLLFIYTKQLDIHGPKLTLHNFTKTCITFVAVSSMFLWQCSFWSNGSALTSPIHAFLVQSIRRTAIALMFLFNNCYVFMIASQQWSFVDSIVTPNEGAQWFGVMTGICSVLCTISAGIIPYILPYTGLIGMYSITAATLYGTLLCGDQAYTIAEQNGFDPALQQNERKKQKAEQQQKAQLLNKISSKAISGDDNKKSSRVSDAITLFRRVPTLRALLLEGVSFQSLGTILSVAMIRALKVHIPDDISRSAYTGRFYAGISGVSALLQFIVLPIGMKRLEPKHLWRLIPVLPIIATVYQMLFPLLNHNNMSQLTMVAGALFITKVLDYSIRVVIYNMAYQPLDFESRFVGKEIINVFGGRVGRSGMSLFLSGLSIFPKFSCSLLPLTYFACSASTIWGLSAWWLSTLLPTKADAQRTVVERRKEFELENKKRQPKQNDK